MFSQKFQRLIVQGALLKNSIKAKAQSPLMSLPKRQFSTSAGLSGGQKVAYGLATASMFGITYINYMAHQQFKHAPKAQQLSHFNPIVKERVQKTFGYFSYACGTTGLITYMLRNNLRLLNMSPIAMLIASMGCLLGTYYYDYYNSWALKNAFFTAFLGSMSVSLLPLIHIYATPVIFDALMATSFTVGALGSVAYMAPSEQFLNWGGPLCLGMGGLMGISMLQILYPQSSALYNLWLYGGLGLFSAYLMYDT